MPMLADLRPQTRISLFYATIFTTNGVASTYFGIWLKDQGIDEGQIGLINAGPVFVMMALNLWIGRIADRASDWRSTIIACCALAAVAPLGLLIPGGFWPILLFWTLTSMGRMAASPVADAATIRMGRRVGFEYAPIRAWGTFGYLALLAVTGLMISGVGAWVFLPLLLMTGFLRFGASLALPRFRTHEPQPAGPGATRLLHVMRPWFVLPLVGWAMVFGTHLVLDAFQGLLWKQQGLPEWMIGFLIALGAAAEMAMFFLFRRTASQVPARWLILASAVVAALRWLAMGFSPVPALLIPLQLLHSVTFALGFLGCVTFIANWTAEEIAAEAQSFFTLLQQIGSVVALTAFGWLAGRYGAHAYFGSAAFAAVGAGLVWLSLRLKQPLATPSP